MTMPTREQGPGWFVSVLRAVALGLALLVPLAIDPWAQDHQLAKSVVLGVAGALALLGEALARSPASRPTSWPERWLALFAVWSAVSAAWAPNAPLAWSRAALAIGMLGVLRAARAAAVEGRTRVMVLAMLGVGAVAMVIDGALVLEATGALDASAAKFSSGLFVHNNLAAGYVTLLAPLAVAMFAARRRSMLHGVVRIVGVVALIGLVAYLFVLRSRGGLLGAALGVSVTALLLALRGRLARWHSSAIVVRALAVVVVVTAAMLPFSDGARGFAKDTFYSVVSLTGLDANDVQRRPVLWAKSFGMVNDHPLLGVGAGNFAVVLPRYDRLIIEVPHAHNDALQVLTELGVVGLALFVAWLVASAAQVGAALVRGAREGPGRAFAAAATGTLTVFVVSGLFETPWALGATASTLALVLGLVAGRLERGEGGWLRPGGLTRIMLLGAVLIALSSAAVRVRGLVLLERAVDAADQGDVAQAIDTYRDLAALPLGSPVPHTMLAQLAESTGDLDEALVHRRAASALWPYGASVLEGEGDVLYALGRHDEALVAFERALASSPGRSELKLKVAFALDRAGRRVEGIGLFESEVQRQRGVDTNVVYQLARLWQAEAEARRRSDPDAPETIEAVVAARHFYAKVLEDGPRELYDASTAPFEYLTDILQQRPGSPDSWWKDVYEPWRAHHGWLHLPGPALFTSLTNKVRKLYPGWELPLGPPRPAWMRNVP